MVGKRQNKRQGDTKVQNKERGEEGKSYMFQAENCN
jgi:hypothetical protein